MLTVADLVAIPHLQLSILAGRAGLTEEVSWVHISDLPNPWEWLGGGELLVTNGLNLPRDGASQAGFLETLHAAGASGLAVGTDMPSPELRPEIRAKADELETALLLVPYSVPFSAIVRAAADANSREEAQRLARITRVYELLRTAVARGKSRRYVLRQLGTEIGCRFFLVDPELGRVIAPRARASAHVAELAAAYENHGGRLPGAVHLGKTPSHAIAVPVPVEQPAALIAEPRGGRTPDLDLLHHVATVGALELASLRAEQERKRRQGAELVARLLDGKLDDGTAREQLREFGLVVDRAVVVAVREADLGNASESLHHQYWRRGIAHAILSRPPNLVVLLPLARAQLEAAVAVLAKAGATVGVSRCLSTPTRVAEAMREAVWSVGTAKASGDPVAHFTGEPLPMLPRTLDEAHLVVSHVLGPLLSYDCDHGSELLRTLRVVLDTDRSWQAAASRLHVHKQTLGYRIRQIERLTGRSLKSTRDIGELWFGLRAYELTQGLPTRPGDSGSSS